MRGLFWAIGLLGLTITAKPLNQGIDQLEAPTVDSFYSIPKGFEKARPGAILKQRPTPKNLAYLGLIPVNINQTHQILYRTTNSFGKPTATVLTVLVPRNADYSKVLSYQIAEDAAGKNCAPSYALQLGAKSSVPFDTIVTQAELGFIASSLEQGWVVIVPDHEGPNAAWLANKLAGQSVLDGIRAAINSSEFTGIRKDAKIALWGYSGGSAASGWAAELKASYAPELNIIGVALGGFTVNFQSIFDRINNGPFSGFLPGAIVGLGNEYPKIKALINKHLQPDRLQDVDKVKQQCVVGNLVKFSFTDVYSLVNDTDVFHRPPATTLLDEISLGKSTPEMPLFIYHSVNDEIAPIGDVDRITDYYCSNGGSVELVRDLLSEHAVLAITGGPRAIAWLIQRFNGIAAKSGCSRKTGILSLAEPNAVRTVPKIVIDALLDIAGKPIGPIPQHVVGLSQSRTLEVPPVEPQ